MDPTRQRAPVVPRIVSSDEGIAKCINNNKNRASRHDVITVPRDSARGGFTLRAICRRTNMQHENEREKREEKKRGENEAYVRYAER